MSRRPSARHVAVVGAGILGSATAFRLARSGVRITLVDRDPPASHASGKNAGHLNPIHLTPPPLIPFALYSFRLHSRLAVELAALGYTGFGREPIERILVAFDDGEARALESVHDRLRGRQAFPVRLLDRKTLRTLEPRVSPHAIAGLLLAGTIAVDAHALTRALVDASTRLGARLVHAPVQDVETHGSRLSAVRAGKERIACDDVVLATGPWVAETEEWLGIRLPVRPIQGQMLRLRPPTGGLRYDLTRGGDALYRRRRDEVWVGGTEEDAGFDATPTPEARERLLAGAARLMPDMAGASLLEHTAALRPMTPNRMPLILRARAWENVLLLNGGGSKGVLLSAGLAQAACGLLLNERAPVPAIPFYQEA